MADESVTGTTGGYCEDASTGVEQADLCGLGGLYQC